jgi:NADH-quinone oxidoreductase subunit C
VSARIQHLGAQVEARLGALLRRAPSLADEVTFEVDAANLPEVCRSLRDTPELAFEMLVDLAGVDYLGHGRDEWHTTGATRTGFSRGVARALPRPAGEAQRFGVTYHLLSVTHNRRLRLRARCEGGDDPIIDSVVDVWAGANWFEREAFDLFGILFRNHPDLRRILTDYGFVGHPFRKDFPLSGHVEVRYDPERGRVVYEPVSIEPRVTVPRVIRDDARYVPAPEDAPKHG